VGAVDAGLPGQLVLPRADPSAVAAEHLAEAALEFGQFHGVSR